MDRVRLVGAAECFGEDVTYTGSFHDGTHGPTGDDAGTRSGWLEHDFRGSKARRDHKGDGCAGERHLYEVLLGIFNAFADCFCIFAGLTEAGANMAVAITNDNECPNTEAPATLDNLCDTAHLYNRLFKI